MLVQKEPETAPLAMRGCDASCPEAPASASAVWASFPFMRTVRIRWSQRAPARTATPEMASIDSRITISAGITGANEQVRVKL
jgi:hypothetical protein